jgi:uncharacterized protein involved in propanediol utilization
MKATIVLTMKTDSTEAMQKALDTLLKRSIDKGEIESYSFEIETADGVVTEKCILSGGKVVA